MPNSSDAEARSRRRFQLQTQILAMPEHQRLVELDSLGSSRWVFEQNYLELRTHALQLLTAEDSVHLTARSNQMLFELFMYELTRRLHNFVASVASLVDHTRRLYRDHYQKHGLFPEYTAEVKTRFADAALVQFVQGLREYMLHYRLPGIALDTEILDLQTERMAHRLTISKKNLQECGFKWNAKAKEFINACVGDSVDLLQAVHNYRTVVVKFYDWFATKQRDIHRKDYEVVSRLQEEILALMAPEVPIAISERLRFLPRVGMIFNVLGVYLTREQDADIAHLQSQSVDIAEDSEERIANT